MPPNRSPMNNEEKKSQSETEEIFTLENSFEQGTLNDNEFIRKPTSFTFRLQHMNIIKDLFLKIIDKQKNQEDLPKFYSVDNILISMNKLQNDRFNRDKFLYLQTNYRNEKFNQIMNLIKSEGELKLALTGLQGSGKSHFLADFVLRNRLISKKSNLRILYINHSGQYLSLPYSYILNEIKYMVSLDIDISQFEMTNSSSPPDKITGSDDIILWLLFVHQNLFYENIKMFLTKLKIYYTEIGIKLVIIWDQINVLERDENKNDLLYQEVTRDFSLFHCIFLSASNNNKVIKAATFNEYFTIEEIDPFKVFDKNEFCKLVKILIEKYDYKPMDFINLKNYHQDLCKFLNYSISEFLCYKNMFVQFFNFRKYSWKEIQDKFIQTRKGDIIRSEQKFQMKYLKLAMDLNDYYQTMKLILTYEEIETMDEETKVNN